MKKLCKGFTLVETIIAISITLILILILMQIYLQSLKVFNIENSNTKIQSYTRDSLDRINSNIKKASSVVSSYTTSTSITYTTSSNSLVLKILSIDSNDNIIPDTYDYVVYKLNPLNTKELYEYIYPSASSSRILSDRVINKNTKSIMFNYYNLSNTEIVSTYENTYKILTSLASEEVVRDKTNQVNYKTETFLRNK